MAAATAWHAAAWRACPCAAAHPLLRPGAPLACLQAHHAGASCPNEPASCDWSQFDSKDPNPQVRRRDGMRRGACLPQPASQAAGPGCAASPPMRLTAAVAVAATPQVLTGALVGGPAGPGDDTYHDKRNDYVTNEVRGVVRARVWGPGHTCGGGWRCLLAILRPAPLSRHPSPGTAAGDHRLQRRLHCRRGRPAHAGPGLLLQLTCGRADRQTAGNANLHFKT